MRDMRELSGCALIVKLACGCNEKLVDTAVMKWLGGQWVRQAFYPYLKAIEALVGYCLKIVRKKCTQEI